MDNTEKTDNTCSCLAVSRNVQFIVNKIPLPSPPSPLCTSPNDICNIKHKTQTTQIKEIVHILYTMGLRGNENKLYNVEKLKEYNVLGLKSQRD